MTGFHLAPRRFGFLAMTPQLWVNYRLKSVAALPAKQFVYKLLNPIIDDMFAFVIKLPLLIASLSSGMCLSRERLDGGPTRF